MDRNRFTDIHDRYVAKELAKEGEEMNEDWSQGLKEEYRDLNGTDILAMAIVESFLGADYAIDKLGFREMAYNYLVKEDTELLSFTQYCMGRYGEENLTKALKSWKTLFDEISEECDVKMCSTEELKNFQLKCLEKAFLLKNKGRLPRMGPWLFCFPFKIIGLYRDDIWEDSILNDITMPAGLEIVRGVKKLIKKRSKFVAGVDANMLSDEEGGLLEGMGTTYIMHGVQKKIAEFSNSNVLHINSGLHLYGQREK